MTNAPVHAQPSAPRPPTLRERKFARRALIAGLASTSVSLGVGGLVAAHHLDAKDPRRRSAGRVGAIPLVGPIVASRRAPEEEKIDFALVAAYQWSAVAILAGGAVLVGHNRRVDRALGVEPRGDVASKVMVAGGLLGSLLAFGVTVGIAEGTYDSAAERRFSSRLRIPVIGGAWAARDAPTHVAGYTGMASSIVQISLLTVTAVGIARMVGKRRAGRRLSIVPMVSPSSTQITGTLRF